MGAWGPGISSNDEYLDVYDEIMKEFNNGTPIETALNKVVEKYETAFFDDTNALHNMYFAAIYAGWECGYLNNNLYNKVKDIIETGKDIQCWRELEASASDLKKREKALTSFLTKISTPKVNPKKPKPLKYKPPLFNKGDVLSIKLNDGTYSGAIVLESIKTSEEFGSNFIVKAYMNNTEMPTVESILNAKVYSYAWYSKIHYKKYIKHIDVIGRVDIKFDYSYPTGRIISGWNTFVSDYKDVYYRENVDIKNIVLFLKLTPAQISNRRR
ncbi:hypothetical protein H1S01_15735 [Heliobacterium chlorum]|uniref:DUF4259 domain-containing protein n=1 Tax=Heliobacterium chlorum TaxID=2698 RepID=A0ABR7T6T2_HELCL|nr:hypothetical protein [Heliobacterium chlorum]MBC9785937.1 hypothetical protein [Heliobacterium chlorum]